MDEQGVREQRIQEWNTQGIFRCFLEQTHGTAGSGSGAGSVAQLLGESLAQPVAQGGVQGVGHDAVRVCLLQRVQLGELLDEVVAFVADGPKVPALCQRLEQQRTAGARCAHEEDGAFETDGHDGSFEGDAEYYPERRARRKFGRGLALEYLEGRTDPAQRLAAMRSYWGDRQGPHANRTAQPKYE